MNQISPIDALSIKQVAEALGISRRYVMALISEGRLEGSFVLGQMRFVPRSSVERFQSLRAAKHVATPNLKESRHASAQ